MTNSLTERLTQLRFTLDRRNEKERGLILACVILGLLLVWYLIAYTQQTASIAKTQTQIQTETTNTNKLNEKRITVENLVKDTTVTKLLEKHTSLQQAMQELDNNFHRYQTRFINYKQLNSLLHAILQQTPGINIVGFSNTIVTTPAEPQKVAPVTSEDTPATVIQSAIPLAERMQYTLVLKGTYFAILDYLKKLEDTGWQLYWDKLVYNVDQYPEATATLEFYTLKALGPQPLISTGTNG